jgi:hypothetical protein
MNYPAARQQEMGAMPLLSDSPSYMAKAVSIFV